MKLTFEQIKSITLGAVRIEEKDGLVYFYRFTKAEEEMYARRSPDDFYKKTFGTAGIKLRFKTDSKTLGLAVDVNYGSSRNYFAFDISVNGDLIGSINNYEGVDFPVAYAQFDGFNKDTVYSKSFELGEGEKEVSVYLPWSFAGRITEMTLDDGASIIPVKCDKTMLVYGDSITHGYDALHPSACYITLVADALGAEQYNKAIGGEIYVPELAAIKQDFTPDYVLVAYGSNDWSRIGADTFENNFRGFYTSLCEHYPQSRIFAVSPIWRKDCEEYREFGSFSRVPEIMERVASEFDNVTFIKGYDFVPEDVSFFADLRLHPNDSGFAHQAKNLLAKLKENL
ncbi:MAG: SGNH/GDSL hydrolase family protein [Clostridia bacterium]|nr:SGNH/GDSL hydrolase family protein [Clostridia bacterium]